MLLDYNKRLRGNRERADGLIYTSFMGHNYFNLLWIKVFGMRDMIAEAPVKKIS